MLELALIEWAWRKNTQCYSRQNFTRGIRAWRKEHGHETAPPSFHLPCAADRIEVVLHRSDGTLRRRILYYLWSQHPDLWYYSKGPGIAMAIRLSTAVFGANEFGVRWLSPLLALGTSLVMFSLARRIYSESVAIWTVLTMNAIPIFNVGALVMTIDPLSIFLWAAALYTFWLALEKSPAFNLWWPLTGLLIGFGFLAKYSEGAMQLLSIALVLMSTKKFRGEFLRAGFCGQ